jgi:hypothetical protein
VTSTDGEKPYYNTRAQEARARAQEARARAQEARARAQEARARAQEARARGILLSAPWFLAHSLNRTEVSAMLHGGLCTPLIQQFAPQFQCSANNFFASLYLCTPSFSPRRSVSYWFLTVQKLLILIWSGKLSFCHQLLPYCDNCYD